LAGLVPVGVTAWGHNWSFPAVTEFVIYDLQYKAAVSNTILENISILKTAENYIAFDLGPSERDGSG
jgi:hypothetical protein